jgi:hypothetical protein
MSELHLLLYTSRISPQSLQDLEATTRTILSDSIHANDVRSITGLLIAHRGWFVQALEGSDAAIHERFGVIARDARHRDVRLLAEGPTLARVFGAWSMCSRVLSETDVAVLQVLDRKGALEPTEIPVRTVFNLLTTVADVHRRTLNDQYMAARTIRSRSDVPSTR